MVAQAGARHWLAHLARITLFLLLCFLPVFFVREAWSAGSLPGVLIFGALLIGQAAVALRALWSLLSGWGGYSWDEVEIRHRRCLVPWRLKWCDIVDATLHRGMGCEPVLVLTDARGRRRTIDFDFVGKGAGALLATTMERAYEALSRRISDLATNGYRGRPERIALCLMSPCCVVLAVLCCTDFRAGTISAGDVWELTGLVTGFVAGAVALTLFGLRRVEVGPGGIMAAGALRCTWLPWSSRPTVVGKWTNSRSDEFYWQTVTLEAQGQRIRLSSLLPHWGPLTALIITRLPGSEHPLAACRDCDSERLWLQALRLLPMPQMPDLAPGSSKPRTELAGAVEALACCAGWLVLVIAAGLALGGLGMRRAWHATDGHLVPTSALVSRVYQADPPRWVTYTFERDGHLECGGAFYPPARPLPAVDEQLWVYFDRRDPRTNMPVWRLPEAWWEVRRLFLSAGWLGSLAALLLSSHLALARRRLRRVLSDAAHGTGPRRT